MPLNRIRRYPIVAGIVAFAVLSTGIAGGARGADPQDPIAAEERPADPEFGYPEEHEQNVGTPIDAEERLDNSFPKRDSVLPGFRLPRSWGYEQWKEDVYDKYGLKLAANFSMIYQRASETSPLAKFDTALGYWASLSASWTPLNRGQDYEGSLVVTLDSRDSLGNNAVPAQFGASDVGSTWAELGHTQWDLQPVELYWQQWLKKDRFFFRAGNQVGAAIYNFFRFGDSRTSFTASPYAFHESIPWPTYGLGFAFKWWPIEGSELYVVGTLNDMNSNPTDRGLDWSTFGRGEYFYGVEIGKFWRREGGEFDHVHLDIFYADKRSIRNPDTLPNEAGGGFRLAGSKQWGRWVGFGGYTYNTARGGAISITFAQHTGTAGAAYLRPLGINGEVGLGLLWMQTFPDLKIGPVVVDKQNQYGLDAYWKILLTPNAWITPGLQILVDPAFNPTADVVTIPHIKFRVFF